MFGGRWVVYMPNGGPPTQTGWSGGNRMGQSSKIYLSIIAKEIALLLDLLTSLPPQIGCSPLGSTMRTDRGPRPPSQMRQPLLLRSCRWGPCWGQRPLLRYRDTGTDSPMQRVVPHWETRSS